MISDYMKYQVYVHNKELKVIRNELKKMGVECDKQEIKEEYAYWKKEKNRFFERYLSIQVYVLPIRLLFLAILCLFLTYILGGIGLFIFFICNFKNIYITFG